MAKRQGKAVAAGLDVSLVDEFKDFEGIQVLERRLKNPDLPGSIAIRLRDEPGYIDDPLGKRRKWYLRWINGSEQGRTSLVTNALGYVPVRMDELQASDALGMHKSDDGIVRRGDRGSEWLAKMPLKLYNAIKAKQQEQRERRSRNAKFVKEDLANAAGRELGSEAGDAVHDEFDVTVKRGRSTYADELNED
jgi:hypothetical protein